MNVRIALAAMVAASAAGAARASALPEGYEQVRYIESTGAQYIDTEIAPDATTIVTVDWQSFKAAGEYFQVLVGTKDGNNNQMTALIGSSNNLQGGVLCAGSGMDSDFIWDRRVRHTVTLDAVANAILVDGEKVKQTTPTATSLPSIYLFARHSPTAGAEYFASGFLYGCKITKGGELVRDYVPCRRTADGKFGLYDLKGGGFCGNEGTGAFGGPIPERDFDRFFRRVKGVASSAGAYVDTMIRPEGRVPQVDLTYRFTDLDASQSAYVFGCYNITAKTGTAIGYQPDPFLHRYRVYDKFCDGIAPTTTVQTVTLNGPNGTVVNGEVVSTEMRNLRDDGVGYYYVFARHYSDDKLDDRVDNFANAIVFALKICMDGEPVRDFVPCVRLEDGAAGFYDRVDGRFFGNSGTGGLSSLEEGASVVVLPYLESDGAQYIDTGVEPDATTIVTVDWLSLKAEGGVFQVIAGTKDANSTPNQMTAGIGSSNNLQGGVLCASGAMSPDEVIWARNARHTVALDAVANAILVDGKKVKQTTPAVTSLPSVYLFARHSPAGTAENFAAGQLYHCTIRKGGVLVRDYVAARRKADGALGLYDRVSGVFTGNMGAGDFSAPYLESEIRRLRYVESSGTQYIKTGVAPDATTVVSVDWKSLKADGENFQVFVGAKDANNNQMTALIGKSNNLQGGVLCAGGDMDSGFIWNQNARHTVTLDAVANAILVDGKKVKQTTPAVTSFTTSIYLFARHSPAGTAENFAVGRLFRCTISKGGDPVLDLQPVKRKSDGCAGLWNRVSGKFYKPEGGELTAGPEIGGLALTVR